MTDFKWEVGPEEVVTVQPKGLLGKQVFLNGRLVGSSSNVIMELGRSKERGEPFELSGGRMGQVVVTSVFPQVRMELRIDGELAYRGDPFDPRTCAKCGATAKAYDKFCAACGEVLPTPEALEAALNVKEGVNAIGMLAILFLVSGGLIAGLQYHQAQKTLKKLQAFDAAAQWSVPVDGETVSVGQLREMVRAEPMTVLLLNVLLAAIMAGLYFWARRAPLPAALVAAAVYLAVVVLSAILDPATLGQGWVMKILIIGLLYRSIKAGFQQRALRA